MEIFAKAAKRGLLIKTSKGMMSPSEVWQLPLKSKNGVSLDSISREYLKEMKQFDEESLVIDTSSDHESVNKSKTDGRLSIDILTYIIKDKQDEKKRVQEHTKMNQKKRELEDLMNQKNAELQKGKSLEELQKEYEELKKAFE